MELRDFRWEDQDGELYLKVSSIERDKAQESFFDVEEAILKAGWMNVNPDVVKKTIIAATNTKTYISKEIEELSEKKAALIEIEIVENKQVFFKVLKGFNTSFPGGLSLKEADFIIKRAGIKACFDLPVLSSFIKSAKDGTSCLAAEEKLPIPGRSAYLKEKVKLSDSLKPRENVDGSVDFRELDSVVQIKKGELLAFKVPPQKGEPGLSLHNEVLPPVEGENVDIEGGDNTTLSDGGLELIASCSGYVYKDDKGRYAIGKLYIVQGDLSFAIGNIKYEGDVFIKGNVPSDFVVEAEGNVQIQGDVEGAVIKAGKNIQIEGGVFGGDKAVLEAGGCLSITQARNAKLICKDLLRYRIGIQECEVNAKALWAQKTVAFLRSCKVTVKTWVRAGVIGSDSTNPQVIHIENDKDKQFVEKINSMLAVKQVMEKESEGYMRQLKTMKKIISQSNQPMSPRSESEIRTLYSKWQDESKKIESCDMRIKMIEKARVNMSGFVAKVEAVEIQAPLNVVVMGQEMSVSSGLQKVRIHWVEKKLVQEAIEDSWSLVRGEGLPVSADEGLGVDEEE
jgi:uncharacterized protein